MSTQVGESAWANTWREVEDRIRTDAATMWAVAGTPKRADVEQIARKHQVPFRVVWAAAVALMNGSPIRRPPQPDDWPIARIAADLPPAAGPSDEEEPESAALGKMLDPITCYLGSDQPVEVQQAAEAATAAIRRLHDTVLAHDRRAQLQARRAQLAAELAAIDAQLSEQVAA